MKIDNNIIEFIKSQHVLSLSVLLPDNQLSACNVFYVFDDQQMCLYFLTELKTQHAKAMLTHPQVAGTINVTPKNILHIQGIQFKAVATQLTDQPAKQAYSHYYRAFPFARIMRAPIWSLALQQIKMTNNLLGFAHKTYWQRQSS